MSPTDPRITRRIEDFTPPSKETSATPASAYRSVDIKPIPESTKTPPVLVSVENKARKLPPTPGKRIKLLQDPDLRKKILSQQKLLLKLKRLFGDTPEATVTLSPSQENRPS